jgi:putative spermidine/putrescine transport system permease protein
MRRLRRLPWASWLWVLLGAAYFMAPLLGTLLFALQKERGRLSLSAFQSALSDPLFIRTFAFSSLMALLTIAASIVIIVPCAYWIHLRYHRMRPVADFLALLPFVIPPIVLVLGLIRTYSHRLYIGPLTLPALTEVSSEALLLGGYVVLALPFMYRSVDNGLRAMNVRSLSEAGASLGAGSLTILWQVILPNLRTALLSGALLTFAIVLGEFTISGFFVGDQRAFGPYMFIVGSHHAFDAAALTLLSFGVTWIAMLAIQLITRGEHAPAAGGH